MFRRQYPWRLPAPQPKESPQIEEAPRSEEARPAPQPKEQSPRPEEAGVEDYLIYGRPLAEDQRHRLSSKVMSWQGEAQTAWLWQMGAVASYWQTIAAKEAGEQAGEQGEKHTAPPKEQLRQVLRQQFPDPDAPAVLCREPFMGLLILAQMQQRQLTGVVASGDPFGAKLWRQAPLALFFQLGHELGEHWQLNRSRALKPKFHLPDFTRKLLRWQDFATKASLRTVADLETLSYPGLRRRYGVFVAQLWQWLFGGGARGADFVAFPWQPWQPQPLPEVTRHLDYPIAAWQGMAPLLAEDVGRLCQQMPVSWRAVQLDWQVTFLHMATLTITVAFRHPHSLHSEQPEQATAVQQAQYGYEALMRTLREREDYLDLPQDLPAVSWRLALSDYLAVHQRAVPLWADSHHHEQIAQMENRLKVPLTRFQLTEDFLPEASFRALEATEPPPRSDCWQLAAHDRPLFIAKEPEPWTGSERGRRFLERIESKWWLSPVEQWPAARRDYYRSWDGRQRSSWLYRDGEGRWFCHGRFD